MKKFAIEVDVVFVRKLDCTIGRCAIEVESSAEHYILTQLNLIQTKVNYVVQEAIVTIRGEKILHEDSSTKNV